MRSQDDSSSYGKHSTIQERDGGIRLSGCFDYIPSFVLSCVGLLIMTAGAIQFLFKKKKKNAGGLCMYVALNKFFFSFFPSFFWLLCFFTTLALH